MVYEVGVDIDIVIVGEGSKVVGLFSFWYFF